MTNPIETVQALVDALFESHPAVAVSGTEAQESKHYAALTAGRSLLAQLKAQPSDDLHGAILNLPITRLRNQITDWRNGYKEGHKDARHAAAELVLAHQGAQEPPVPEGLKLVPVGPTEEWISRIADTLISYPEQLRRSQAEYVIRAALHHAPTKNEGESK